MRFCPSRGKPKACRARRFKAARAPVPTTNPISRQKKRRPINAYRLPAKRIDLSLAVWLHIHVTGFVIQSRNCHLRLTTADSSKQFWKRRYFPLAYRRRCPALSRSLNQICENIYSVVGQINYHFILYRTNVRLSRFYS